MAISSHDRGCAGPHFDRRTCLTLLGAGVAAVLAGCSSGSGHGSARATTLPPTVTTTLPPLPPIPAARAGAASVVSKGPAGTSNIAITIDDGYCDECVSAYIDFAEQSGTHLSFAPNGTYRAIWDKYASRLQDLARVGQVQIANHTWSHRKIVGMSNGSIRSEIERNEDWIQQSFGITARPWFRPPFGTHNGQSDDVAAGLGYTKILLWNGTFGDATPETPEELLALASEHLRPGRVMLGHANHPVITHLFPDIQRIISERGLTPVTLDEMFGTSRATG
ncbi:MAG TPA: polysaccharide deacetylase family protein [Acidimicrobiales bacterium]|nr:polysaccharide deacetylase family protein [Acidimicrobiales bacterium]